MGEVIQQQELSNEQQELFILTSPLTPLKEEMEAEESENLTNGNKDKDEAIQMGEGGLEENSTEKGNLTNIPVHVTGSQFEEEDHS